MIIKICAYIQKHYRESVPFNQSRNFKAGEELTIESKNIQKLTDGNWQFCYSDLSQGTQLTYPFHITQDEIKNPEKNVEILYLTVAESEFEELIKIPSIKELIDADKVGIYPYSDTNTRWLPLSAYEKFDSYLILLPKYES